MKSRKQSLTCKSCQREVPNKDHLTKNGCKWCDVEYRKKHGHK